MTNESIVVVGGGGSGTAAMVHTVKRAVETGRSDITIHWVEMSGELCSGLAYGTRNVNHILNMQTSTLSINPGDKFEFLTFSVSRHFADPKEERCTAFQPRRHMTPYLEHRYAQAKAQANDFGIDLREHRAQVIDIAAESGGCVLTFASGQTLKVSRCILAIGNQPATSYGEFAGDPNYINHIWPEERLDVLDPKATVGVIGTSLSAIDLGISLEARGHEGKLIMASRSGVFPQVRADFIPGFQPQFLTPVHLERLRKIAGKRLSLSRLGALWEEECIAAGVSLERINLEQEFERYNPIEALREQVRHATVRDARFTVIQGVSEQAEHIWHAMRPAAQVEFQRRYAALWGAVAYPCPQVNGKRLLKWLQDGWMELPGPLARERSAISRSGSGYEIRYLDGTCRQVDALVNATGQAFDLKAMPDPLIRNLISRGMMTPHRMGGAKVEFASGALIGRDGHVNSSIYLVGSLTRGTHFFTNSLAKNAEAAVRAVDTIFDQWARGRLRAA